MKLRMHNFGQPIGHDIGAGRLALAAGLCAAFALAGCDNRPASGPTVGQQVDKAIDKTNNAMEKAGTKIEESAKSAGDAMKSAAEKAGDNMADAAITAAIKGELLKDPAVSALRIDVETEKGVVTLKGEANSTQGRERAEQIAQAASGVVKVQNQINVNPKS